MSATPGRPLAVSGCRFAGRRMSYAHGEKNHDCLSTALNGNSSRWRMRRSLGRATSARAQSRASEPQDGGHRARQFLDVRAARLTEGCLPSARPLPLEVSWPLPNAPRAAEKPWSAVFPSFKQPSYKLTWSLKLPKTRRPCSEALVKER